MPPVMLKKKKRAAGMLFAPASKAATILQHGDKAAKKHDSVPIPKKQISTDQQSVFIEMKVSPVFAKKWQSEAAPDHVSDPVSDDRTCSRGGYNDGDVDQVGGCGKRAAATRTVSPRRGTPALSSATTNEMTQGPWTRTKPIR